MRPGILLPALAIGAALLAPPLAEAGPQRSPERGRGAGYERSNRSHDRYERGRSRHTYGRDRARAPQRPGSYRPAPRGRHPYYRPGNRGYYYRPGYRGDYYRTWPHPYSVRRPYPRRYYAPWPAPYGYPGPAYYGPWVPYRGGVHGSVSIGLPFIGFSLHF